MQTWFVIYWAFLALVGADECPDGGRCEDGQTCCSSPTNGYGCCPFDQAECCEDHIHCCPGDTICNPDTSSCVNATVSIPWLERTFALQPTVSKSFRMIKTYMGEEDDNICPDQSRCPAEFSCLKALTKFGCCPLAKGISCSDGKHCCPEGHRCSIDSRSCIKKELVTAVLCNDGVSECPDDTTCCDTPEGKWGCCPMPKAVCCDDKTHCCPDGTTCDTKQMKCISTSTKKELPMWAKFPARLRADWENQKEDEEITAKAADGGKTEKSTAVTTTNPVPYPEEEVTVSTVAKADAVNNVPCNETASCHDGKTCCKTKEGGWACCPLPEAVCCEDFIHCCPKGKKCNMAEQTCEDATCSVPWLEKIPAISRLGEQVQVKNVPCDDTTACPDGKTCCKTKEGGWACCPLPEAVCCEDFIHCCPKGKKCNMAEQTCEDATCSVPWLEKIPAISRLGEQVQVKNVPCDDTTACPDGKTCCKTKEGGWACCPLPEAVCCEDFIHCCPKGKKCNMAEQTCEDATCSVPWLEKIPAISRLGEQVQVKNVPCDDTTACPDGNTCCKTKEGGWACCPLPKAVCCDDHEHCCPEGTTCDPTYTQCLNASGSTPAMQKIPVFTTAAPTTLKITAQSFVTSTTETNGEEKLPPQETDEEEDEKDRNQCDEHTSCPPDTTCCFMASFKKWGCCPLPKAVCCADGSHCCPENYKCNEDKTTCIKGEVEIPWYTKLPAITSVQADYSNVRCNMDHQCPKHTSCCRLFTGEWGCCPLQNAVCCSDKEHCCPQGYTCNVFSKTCQKVIMLQLETLPLTPVYLPEYHLQLTPLKPREIQCDDQTSCQDSETCCRTSPTTWGCCPSPHAVCCSDMKHCCPTGYTCGEGGSCIQNSGLDWKNWNMFLANKKRALIL
ncbi:progranulin-like [Girardinichthys multiradiatus]|uniref:progranulin-like n=1 Tax=Girardinichthys multiradiatus TaxID=208333 RepID=UPI001FADD34B|nr:progranulin-like [Girardinichthys multiradiatus]XP_047213528.1 progranulin-like [Girardinichthys multiradiatus]